MKMSGKNSGIFFEILMRKSDFPGFTHFFILKKDGFKMKQTEQTGKQRNRRQPEIRQTARRDNRFDIQNRRFRRDNAGATLG